MMSGKLTSVKSDLETMLVKYLSQGPPNLHTHQQESSPSTSTTLTSPPTIRPTDSPNSPDFHRTCHKYAGKISFDND